MKSRLVGGIAVLCLVGLMIYWGEGLDREAAFTAETGSGEEASDEIQPPEPVPGDELAPIEPQAVAVPAEAAPEPREEPPAKAPAAPDPTTAFEETVRQRPPEPTGPLQELKRAYAGQSADAGAEQLERLIRSFFGAEHLPEEAARSVSCHMTVCKIGMFWSREVPLSYMAMAMKLAENKMNIIAVEPLSAVSGKGEMPLDMYVVREGYTLQDLE